MLHFLIGCAVLIWIVQTLSRAYSQWRWNRIAERHLAWPPKEQAPKGSRSDIVLAGGLIALVLGAFVFSLAS